jgi:hypothetical protein
VFYERSTCILPAYLWRFSIASNSRKVLILKGLGIKGSDDTSLYHIKRVADGSALIVRGEQFFPRIEDTPASQLTVTNIVPDKGHPISPRVEKVPDPVAPEVVQLSHPMPNITLPTSLDESKPVMVSPDLKDEAGTLDEEYYSTFNATITEVKDLEPEALQALRHRLDRMIRRAKIQQRAIRVTEEGKLSLIDEKRRAKIKAKDTEFMSNRRKADDATDGPRAPRKAASKDTGLSQVEKQIKQFVKLNMNEATIRATLNSLGTAIPENLTALIAKHRK